MISASGVRIGWHDLPPHVRDAVELIIGDTVVSARSQRGGFSPGSTDRLITAGGRRAFCKAAGTTQNPDTPALHRREARVAAALPPGLPAPRLLGSHDDGEWVALVFADVEGRHPVTPWRRDEVDAVLAALADLAAALTPAPLPDTSAVGVLGPDFAGWLRVAAQPPPGLHPWAAANLDPLCALAELGTAALAGETLCHLDVRADNLLIDAGGRITVVDWPWASRGPSWLDTLLLLVNVRLYGGHDSEALLRRATATRDADPDAVTGVLAGLAGFFTDAARRPAPPGLPTVRAFQSAQAGAALSWVRERLAVRSGQ